MSKNKNTIIRSLQQSLYKYLPRGYADFDVDRNPVTGYISYWKTLVSESENKERIAYEIEKRLRFVYATAKEVVEQTEVKGPIEDQLEFFENLVKHKENSFDIYYLEGKAEEDQEPEIISYIRPFVFYCNRCRLVHIITDYDIKGTSEYFNRYKYRIKELFNPLNHKCKKCEGNLIQQQLVKVTPLGYLTDYEPLCEIHKENTEYYVSKDSIFTYRCSECGKNITRKYVDTDKLTPALDPSVLFPQMISILDTKDDENIKEITSQKYLPKLAILFYMKVIDEKKYRKLRQELLDLYEENKDNMNNFDRKVRRNESLYYELNKLNEPSFDTFASENPDPFYVNMFSRLVDIDKINKQKTISKEELLNNLEEIISDFPALIKNIEKTMIEDIFIAEKVPITTVVYGYTRFSPEIGFDFKTQAILNLYKDKEKDKYNFYRYKLLTEGVYIKFSTKNLLNWLKSSLFDGHDNKVFGDKDQKDNVAFFNHYIGNSNENEIIETLIHTISHVFMKELSNISGLEISSMSEIIFPEVASIFIYATSNEGVVLNSIKTAILRRLDLLLKRVLDSITKCSLKPICDEKEASACIGCVYVNELSCSMFNKYLNRKFLTGSDKQSGLTIDSEFKFIIKKGLWT